MKKIIYIVTLFLIFFGLFSCTKDESSVQFKDQVKNSIFDYIEANKTYFSSFEQIVIKGGISGILEAYNPYDEGYTLFLPTNQAIDEFIKNSGKYSSLDDLLNDEEYVSSFCKYHVVKKGFLTDDFPFGAFPSYTLSGDILTVRFISGTDSSYYKINNQAPVSFSNVEVSNGYIHIISTVLEPIVYTTYGYIENHPGYSIFKQAIDKCGLKNLFDVNSKLDLNTSEPYTLFLEHDSVFAKRNISSVQDLVNRVSPADTNYTSRFNPLYNFVTYHMLTSSVFLDDFADKSSNYTTYSDVPLNVNGVGIDIVINKGKEVFDTLFNMGDTTIIDYIGINIDESNINTNSGVIHLIDQVMTQKQPSAARQDYQFSEEPLLNELRQVAGSYLIEDSTALRRIKYSGSELYFVTGETSSNAWNYDYLMMNGNFSISYTIPKLIQGMYNIYLRADISNSANAVVQIYIDGKKIGGLLNLTSGSLSWDTYSVSSIDPLNVGIPLVTKYNFIKYEEHTVTIKSFIPGRLLWDAIIFRPSPN